MSKLKEQLAEQGLIVQDPVDVMLDLTDALADSYPLSYGEIEIIVDAIIFGNGHEINYDLLLTLQGIVDGFEDAYQEEVRI